MELPFPSPGITRNLPPRDIPELTNSTLEDSYVEFILYCNPSLPPGLSTVELRRGFRSVPRSDGKSFETLTVFQLYQKLEAGNISTWSALVTELGVEPPDVTKGGSSQKLQQYAVRLKKWAKTFRIDAFFHYMIGNTHPYFTQIPEGPNSVFATRDGIAPEDDQALRALVPTLRPKRGRKKGNDEDNDSVGTPSKKLRAGTPNTIESRGSPRPDLWGRSTQSPAPNYIPQSATPHLVQTLPPGHRMHQTPIYTHDENLNAMFARADAAFHGGTTSSTQSAQSSTQAPIQHIPGMDWGPSLNRSQSDYPHSAIDPHPPNNTFGTLDLDDGSRSAHPSGPSRGHTGNSGRRGVSAAWTNSSPAVQDGRATKTRGRPPRNRTANDGSFGTWSIKESIEEDQGANNVAPGLYNYPAMNKPAAAVAPMQQANTSVPAAPLPTRKPPVKKLSLTVPDQPGGNIRLATPPVIREQAAAINASPLPRVTLNDDKSLSRPRSSTSKTREQEALRERERQRSRFVANDRLERRSSADFYIAIDEEASQGDVYDRYDDNDELDNGTTSGDGIDWKRRALFFERKMKEAENELKRMRKAVMEAVM